MDTYFFCFDESASAATPARDLTPRAIIWADSRSEARETFQRLAKIAFRGFGKAAVRKETRRERERLVGPLTSLPDAVQYAAGSRGVDPADIENEWYGA